MSKISELSDGGSLLPTDDLIVVRSGGNVRVKADTVNVDQIRLGDDEQIQLGNSQDLTLVHTPTQSIINQAGTGDLLIQKAGATKLTVNSTGIDVTGSVTADGANIDGAVTTGDLTIDNDDTPTLNFKKAASADILGTINVTTDAGSGGKMVFQTKRNGDTALDRITIDDGGNVGIGSATANHFSTAGATNILGVKGTSGGLISIAATGTNFSGIDVGTDTTRRGGIYSLDGSHLAFYTNATNSGGSLTEAMRITSAGSIQIPNQDAINELEFTGTEYTNIYSTTTSGMDVGTTGSGFLRLLTNNTERLRIDASGNVGINTTNPAQRFVVAEGTDQHGIELAPGTLSYIQAYDRATADYGDLKIDAQTIQFGTDNGTEAMRIDASGNVGIGTSSPTRPLHVSTSGVIPLRLTSTGTDCQIELGNSGGTPIIGSFNDQLIFNTASTERMRILADGSVCQSNTVSLVASNYNNQAGAAWHEPDGHYEIATTSNVAPLEIGKNNATDGSLVVFRKQSTVVGSIGTANADSITIGNSTGNLILYAGTVAPSANSSGGASDGVVDLGTSARRFKDLHLSGGAYLGGTAAANKLDDYEEGDYDCTISCGTSGTISLNGSFNRAAYTKVGRLVTVHGFIVVAAVSSPVGFFNITLPFTPASLTDRAGDSTVDLVIQNVVSANISDFVGTINEGDARIYVQLGDNTAIQNDSAQQIAANTYIHFSTTYSTA